MARGSRLFLVARESISLRIFSWSAIITDPPYASGGRTQAEKNKSPAKKYSSMGDHAPPPFDGDSKDQRSWTRWAAEWLSDARKLCKPGAPVCMFIDWR